MRAKIASRAYRICIAALLVNGASIHAAPAPAPAPAPSVMEIPLTVDLQPLFRKAETTLPREVGHWRGWRKQKGLETRYRAWRGPLAMQLTGDLLQVQAHVRYWVQARKRILGTFDLQASCGVDEPPRQAVVGVLVRIGLGPDWTLRPRFRFLPTRFLDGCEVTIADIDVTPIVERVFRRRMKESLRSALEELRSPLEAARLQALRSWHALQQPVELASGVWLTAGPFALALAPLQGGGQQMTTVLGVALAPRIGVAVPAAARLRGLPPLQTFFPRGRGMHFDLAVDLDLADLGEHLARLLAGQPLSVQGHSVGIERIELGGAGAELRIRARLTGEAAGWIEIRAEPLFDEELQTVRLRELDFVYDPEDIDQAMLANLFYERIRQALEDNANSLLEDHTGDLRRRLGQALAQALPQGLTLDTEPLRLERLEFRVSENALRLRGTAAGNVEIRAR